MNALTPTAIIPQAKPARSASARGSPRPRQAPKSSRSALWQKAGATTVNASVAALLAAPFTLVSFEAWRLAAVAAFFGYNLACRDCCWGCRAVGSVPNRPATLCYVALYTLGFSTCLYSFAVPGDLLVINGAIQAGFLAFTGNTAHGWLGGVYTFKAR